jgi:gamma-glutamylcyclotransferase (GGCT)/AIG2-like uncharacterized protein YtfP
MKVFVYGTLKTNHGNWHRLLRDKAVFVGAATTVDTYTMLCPSFPVLLDNLDGHRVKGEVFECDAHTVDNLDLLEGEGSMYHRRLVCVTYDDGRAADEVSIYIGGDYWARSHYPTIKPNTNGLLEWTTTGHCGYSYQDEQDDTDDTDDTEWEDDTDIEFDELFEEPEDQDPGDVLGEHDEREQP